MKIQTHREENAQTDRQTETEIETETETDRLKDRPALRATFLQWYSSSPQLSVAAGQLGCFLYVCLFVCMCRCAYSRVFVCESVRLNMFSCSPFTEGALRVYDTIMCVT